MNEWMNTRWMSLILNNTSRHIEEGYCNNVKSHMHLPC